MRYLCHFAVLTVNAAVEGTTAPEIYSATTMVVLSKLQALANSVNEKNPHEMSSTPTSLDSNPNAVHDTGAFTKEETVFLLLL